MTDRHSVVRQSPAGHVDADHVKKIGILQELTQGIRNEFAGEVSVFQDIGDAVECVRRKIVCLVSEGLYPELRDFPEEEMTREISGYLRKAGSWTEAVGRKQLRPLEREEPDVESAMGALSEILKHSAKLAGSFIDIVVREHIAPVRFRRLREDPRPDALVGLIPVLMQDAEGKAAVRRFLEYHMKRRDVQQILLPPGELSSHWEGCLDPSKYRKGHARAELFKKPWHESSQDVGQHWMGDLPARPVAEKYHVIACSPETVREIDSILPQYGLEHADLAELCAFIAEVAWVGKGTARDDRDCTEQTGDSKPVRYRNDRDWSRWKENWCEVPVAALGTGIGDRVAVGKTGNVYTWGGKWSGPEQYWGRSLDTVARNELAMHELLVRVAR